MPKYRFLGDETRIFPDSTVTVDPGDVVECDGNPDERWFELDGDTPPAVASVTPEEVHEDGEE